MQKKGESKATSVLLAKQESQSLFDIAACHCFDFSTCNCPRDLKVPVLAREFLFNQSNDRKMFIGSLDKEKTCKLSKKSERASKRVKFCDFQRSTARLSETEEDIKLFDDGMIRKKVIIM